MTYTTNPSRMKSIGQFYGEQTEVLHRFHAQQLSEVILHSTFEMAWYVLLLRQVRTDGVRQ